MSTFFDAAIGVRATRQAANYIMPPIPPIPPMPPMSGIPAPSFCGRSVTIASVVIIRPATDAANCSALRVTLVGSRIPISSMSPAAMAGLAAQTITLSEPSATVFGGRVVEVTIHANFSPVHWLFEAKVISNTL